MSRLWPLVLAVLVLIVGLTAAGVSLSTAGALDLIAVLNGGLS